jgi:hypothetical protein
MNINIRYLYRFIFPLMGFILLNSLAFSQVSEENCTPSKELVEAKLAKLAKINGNTGIGKISEEQNQLKITGPEQNCSGAIAVCNQTYSQSSSYTGHGTLQEVSTSTCLSGGETNSVWYVFTAQSSGTFGFTLTTTKDYDFALYNITTIGCSGVPSATPVRCNFSATYGNTGMDVGTAIAELPANSIGAGGSPISPGINNVVAGNTYALIIDNWTGDQTGYTLTFTGTAPITDNTDPTINPPNSIVNNCNNTVTITTSEGVQCGSIASNGSDFSISGGGTISAALGVGCSGSTGLTNTIIITYTAPSSGTYTISVKTGSDGNTLLDKCGRSMAVGQSVSFQHLGNLSLSVNPNVSCTSGGAVVLTPAGAPGGTTYTLNPGGLTSTTTFTVYPTITTTYTVSATYGGCTKTANATATIEGNIITEITPPNKTICALTSTTLTASTTINGVNCPSCTYLWSTNETTSSINVGVGTYTVTATTPNGCHNSNSPSSTVSLASSGAGGGTCDVLYVSPTGCATSGCGTTKDYPASLPYAITQAQCTNTIIKMQVGIYNFSDFNYIHSYVTIEGGYNVGFTKKSSDMSGGTNSTTIRRSNTGDTGDNTKCSAFVVDDGADQFRLQDLRIELPGSPNVPGHAAGANKTNYGIRLGSGCTNYNIVRCYIDAGTGSAP